MANSKSSSGVRNFVYPGMQAHASLPPKSPFPSISQAYADCVSNPTVGSRPVNKLRDGNTHHQRTSFEIHLIEELPSWLDDLLNEPDTPIPAWSSPDFDRNKDARHVPMYSEMNAARRKNRSWDSFSNMSGALSGKDSVAFQRSGSPTPCTLYEADRILPTANENHDSVESGLQNTISSFERKDDLHTKSSASETDTKRAKQQFAQRSRVRKLQYMAELERNVQSLQAEGSKVSAELEFLNQQNLILSMENKALKQRLESLAQEQLIKYLEKEVLEREIGRLRGMYQQQAPMTQQSILPPQQQLMPQIQFQPFCLPYTWL